MKIEREEIWTGMLVIITWAIFIAIILFLGAPGVFIPQKTYQIYFDNAAALRPGAEVLLAGRRIGRVEALYSPVPEKDRPKPGLETRVEVSVAKDSAVYQDALASISQPRILADPVIDFTHGNETAGVAEDGYSFIGIRPPGLEEIVPKVLEEIKPVMAKATETLDALQKTASGPLDSAIRNIETLTGDEGPIQTGFRQLVDLTGPESHFALTLRDAHRIVAPIAESDDLERTLKNLRESSAEFKRIANNLGPRSENIARNLEQASDTLKHQPWRLIWPTTKKYPQTNKDQGNR